MTNDSNDASFVICHLVTQMTNDLSHLINIVYYVKFYYLFYLFKAIKIKKLIKTLGLYRKQIFLIVACIYQIT